MLWFAIGAVLLLSTTGNLRQGPIDLVGDGWPWVLVGLGAWFLIEAILPFGGSPIEDLTIPLGGATETGASETRIHMPRAASATTVRAKTGAASLIVEIPRGVAARIRSRMAIESSQIDEARFARTATGYESADYGQAANRVDLDLQGAVGSIRVVAGD